MSVEKFEDHLKFVLMICLVLWFLSRTLLFVSDVASNFSVDECRNQKDEVRCCITHCATDFCPSKCLRDIEFQGLKK